jgi:hypothetical protein
MDHAARRFRAWITPLLVCLVLLPLSLRGDWIHAYPVSTGHLDLAGFGCARAKHSGYRIRSR